MKDNFVPKLTLSTKDVTFNGLSYGDTKTELVEFENAGDGLLEFEINKLSEASIIGGSKKGVQSNCLTIEPLRGVIKAGEKITISIKMQIAHREA